MSDLLSDNDRATLFAVVRTAFPHSTFPDGPYERAADAVVVQAGSQPRLHALLLQGLAEVDAQRDRPFADLDIDSATAVLRSIDRTPFLTAIVNSAVVTIYSDPEVWGLLGYEGPSFDRGGYLDRGFDDLDWLPEPRIELDQEVSA